MLDAQPKVGGRKPLPDTVTEQLLHVIAYKNDTLFAGSRPARGFPQDSWHAREQIGETLALGSQLACKPSLLRLGRGKPLLMLDLL
jgi:hypothetical protein